MAFTDIQLGAEIIGADSVHIGTVDRVDGHRIKIRRKGALTGKKHFIDAGFVADIEDGVIRLSANADVVILLEDEED